MVVTSCRCASAEGPADHGSGVSSWQATMSAHAMAAECDAAISTVKQCWPRGDCDLVAPLRVHHDERRARGGLARDQRPSTPMPAAARLSPIAAVGVVPNAAVILTSPPRRRAASPGWRLAPQVDKKGAAGDVSAGDGRRGSATA